MHFQRYEDAQILLRADRTTGAVYLAGYGIKCILKALVLSAVAPAAHGPDAQLLSRGEGTRLRMAAAQYLENGGARFPRKPPELSRSSTIGLLT